jgi:hypothetical protein
VSRTINTDGRRLMHAHQLTTDLSLFAPLRDREAALFYQDGARWAVDADDRRAESAAATPQQITSLNHHSDRDLP